LSFCTPKSLTSLCPHSRNRCAPIKDNQTCWQREFKFSAAALPPRSRASAPPAVPKIHPLPCCAFFTSCVLELDSLVSAQGSGWVAAKSGPAGGAPSRLAGGGWWPASLSRRDLVLHHSGWLAILKLTCWVGGSNLSTLEPGRARAHQFGALVRLNGLRQS